MNLNVLSCKCLNVMLTTDELRRIADVSSFHLDENQSQEVFFHQELRQASRLFKLVQTLPSIVEMRKSGNWTFYECLNCRMHTHAVMIDNGQQSGASPLSVVLVNENLLKGADIDAMRKDHTYSAVYKIRVFFNDEEHKEFRCDYLPAEIEKSISALKQQADECINIETQAIEERIRIYTEGQVQRLNDFKDRTHMERKHLNAVLFKHYNQPSNKTRSTKAMELTTSTDDNVMKPSSLRKVPDTLDHVILKTAAPQQVLNILEDSPVSSRRQSSPLVKTNSLDTECLFELDGMEDEDAPDETDDSDNEGIAIPNRHARKQQPALAKSVPMDIPHFMAMRSRRRGDSDDDEDDDDFVDNTTDIAASIQALARSVHKDAVFGDLPQTRCRTLI